MASARRQLCARRSVLHGTRRPRVHARAGCARMSRETPPEMAMPEHPAKKKTKTVGFEAREPTWAPAWARAGSLRSSSPATQALADDVYFPPSGHGLSVQRRLGAGAYGTVHEALDERSGRTVALKQVDGLFGRDFDTHRLTTAVRTLRELAILRACSSHPQIVGFNACLAPSDPRNFSVLWMSMELCWKDLHEVIGLCYRIRGWNIAHAKAIAHQLLCGLSFLHRAAVVHRDLKPSNLLLTTKTRLKICDFGLARQIEKPVPLPRTSSTSDRPTLQRTRSVTEDAIELDGSTAQKPGADMTNPTRTAAGLGRAGGDGGGGTLRRQLTQMVVTRWYRAPELFCLEEDYTAAIDTWSAGCILAELFHSVCVAERNRRGTPKPHEEELRRMLVARHRALFPGAGSYPLDSERGVAEVDPRRMEDAMETPDHQLHRIFGVIGTPSPDAISRLSNPTMRGCLLKLANTAPQEPQDLAPKYRELEERDTALMLLKSMLEFDPAHRPTPAELLESKWFDSVLPVDRGEASIPEGAAVPTIDLTFGMAGDSLADATAAELRKLLLAQTSSPPAAAAAAGGGNSGP